MIPLSSVQRSVLRPAVLGLTLLIAACGDPVGFDSFEEARDRWEARAVDHYSFVLRPLCFCIFTGPALVTVEGGEIVSVMDGETGEPIEDDRLVLMRTIDELFTLLDDAWKEDAHRVQVEYDPEYGYPADLWIDYSENVADEELGYQVTEFTVVD